MDMDLPDVEMKGGGGDSGNSSASEHPLVIDEGIGNVHNVYAITVMMSLRKVWYMFRCGEQ